MAYEYESKETRVLETIDSKRYPDSNKDFVKNIRRLNSSVDYMSSYMRLMQKGIDDANKNFIEQIQTFINDLVVLFAGGEPTGIDIGDLKYIFQAIGALFGFDGVFPVNLINAASHFFTAFLTPLTQFTDLIFDAVEAWMQDLIDHAGDIPIIGGAVVTLASWLKGTAEAAEQAVHDAADAFAHAGEIIDSFLRALGLPTWSDVELWFTNLFQGFLYGIDFGNGFDLADAAIWFINVVLSPVNLLAKLVGGFIEALHIPGLDASIIVSGHFAQSMILGLGEALTNLANYIGLIFDTFLNALGLPTWSDVEKWFQNLFQGLFYGIDFGDGFDLLEAATWFINVVLLPVNIIAKLVGNVIEAIHIPGLDASVITSGTFAQSMIAGLGTALSNLTKFINDVIDAIEGAFRGIPVIGSGIANLIDGIQNFFNGLFGQPTPAATVAAAAVPSIDASKVGSGTFGSGRIADGAVTAAKVADGNITAAKVADGNIVASKIADGNITAAKILDGAVNGAKTTSLDASKITSGSIASGLFGAQTISGSHLVNDTITSSQIATNAVTTNELNALAVTNAKIADAAVTGAQTTTLDASKISTGTINALRLPSSLTTVGSGCHLPKRGNTPAPHTTTYSANGTIMPWSFYNTTYGTVTSDITISSNSTYLCATISNAGWYMIEVAFALKGGADFANYTYHWGLTPAIYKSTGTTVPTYPYRLGATGVSVVDSSMGYQNTWSADVAVGNFIVYLNANDTIYPGYFWSREGNVTSDVVIRDSSVGNGPGTYFTIALLNRSLA